MILHPRSWVWGLKPAVPNLRSEIFGEFWKWPKKVILLLMVQKSSGWWFQIFFNFHNFHPYLGKWSNLTSIFQRGWNHQLVLLMVQKSCICIGCKGKYPIHYRVSYMSAGCLGFLNQQQYDERILCQQTLQFFVGGGWIISHGDECIIIYFDLHFPCEKQTNVGEYSRPGSYGCICTRDLYIYTLED